MKRTILYLLIIVSLFILNDLNAQTDKVTYSYSKPSWTVGFGPAWNLATNDAYGRANYSTNAQVLRDNYGMRWGVGGYIFGKYSPGKTKADRIYLGFDYKGMTNTDFESDANKTSFDIITFDAGYEYVFYGTYGFRSYYGIGLTGNLISGEFIPQNPTATNLKRNIESTFRVGMEIKAGLEFVLNNSKKNLGINVGGRYNLTNLFNADNALPTAGQTDNFNLNDGGEAGGPGFKRYIGIFSLDVGLNIYPDVKKTKR